MTFVYYYHKLTSFRCSRLNISADLFFTTLTNYLYRFSHEYSRWCMENFKQLTHLLLGLSFWAYQYLTSTLLTLHNTDYLDSVMSLNSISGCSQCKQTQDAVQHYHLKKDMLDILIINH